MTAPPVTVRMYNVGFGDCFLISIQDQDLTRRILVDCGTHLSGQGPRPIKAVAAQVVEDVTAPGREPAIDVVVATHRHFDHIAGFDSEVWSRVRVSEVWLPWTEDPRDPVARRIHDAQTRAAVGLDAYLATLRSVEAEREIVANVLALSNTGAMGVLHDGFAGKPLRRFLPRPDQRSFTTSALPGVRIHVLGPSRDESIIKAMDPPASQSYLQSVTGDGERKSLRPFAWSFEASKLEEEPEIIRLRDSLEQDPFDLAVALEAAVNGTSLVLAFEIGRAVLLFTGDAQWGTWNAALSAPEWQELVARTTFLKVGHHGSHNATPKLLVEDFLPDGFAAMVSVAPVARWPRIPKRELVERLLVKSPNLVRSDQIDEAPASFQRAPDDSYVEAVIQT